MNNQAFRKLVYQHTNKPSSHPTTPGDSIHPKSNKEIARDAVQQEFNEIKKRKLNDGVEFDGDFDISDDDDDDDTNNKNDKNGDGDGNDDESKHLKKDQQKRGRQSKKNKGDDENDAKNNLSKYRDRAKERREQLNLDYEAADKISLPNDKTAVIDDDMTKFLGGDEQFTHLVKGLDRTLADKVRREDMTNTRRSNNEGQSSILPRAEITMSRKEDINHIDLDQIMEDAQALKAQKEIKLKKLKRHENEATSSSSLLATTMANYLQKMKANQSPNASTSTSAHIMNPSLQTPLSTSAQTLHRSTLTFSLHANRQNLQQYGWELPCTSIVGRNRTYVDNTTNIKTVSCTPVDSNLICKIKSILVAINNKKKKNSDEVKEKNKKRENKEVTKIKLKAQENDSDDDIYGDIGDYVPLSVL